MDFASVYNTTINILGTLVLIIGAIGGTYAGVQWIIRTFFAPKIELTFDKAKTFHKRRDAGSGVKFIWIHVHALNESKHVFHECKAYLTDIKTIATHKATGAVIEFNTVLPLDWAHSGGMKLIDLLPKKESAIDLFMVDHIHKLLITCTDQIPSGTQKTFLPGTYELVVQCFSKDAKSGQIRLRLEWDGVKPYPEVELID